MTKRKKNDSRSKPLPPSKRLRLEAQRVLKERVQDIADKKGIKLRFCNLKECENHVNTLDSPCASTRMEIGWPPGVPFVHPHDMPNKSKIGFLEAYEPGWSATHDMELSLTDPGQGSQHSANCNFQSCSGLYLHYYLQSCILCFVFFYSNIHSFTTFPLLVKIISSLFIILILKYLKAKLIILKVIL